MSRTPTLDKYNLHPFGGYVNQDPTLHDRILAAAERWKNLSPEDRQKADEEFELVYPSVDDHASGGR